MKKKKPLKMVLVKEDTLRELCRQVALRNLMTLPKAHRLSYIAALAGATKTKKRGKSL